MIGYLFVFIFFAYGCSVKMAPLYSGEQYEPVSQNLYSSKLNLFLNINNVSYSTAGTGSFRTSLENYLKNYLPNWNIYSSSYQENNVSNDFYKLHIFVDLKRKGQNNLTDNLSFVKIISQNEDINYTFEVSMESQSAGMGFFNSYRVREGHNFGILVGKKIIDTLEYNLLPKIKSL